MPESEDSRRTEDHLPVPSPPREGQRRQGRNLGNLVQPVAIVALIFGLIGGAAGSYGFIRFFADAIPANKKQLVVEESSAIIDVAKKVSPAVVSITSKTLARGFFGTIQEAQGAGTGMIVTSDGLIMTNRHVVDDANANYTVITHDGKSHQARVVSRDTSNDIAFMRITASNLPTVELADSGSVRVGQRVVAIGNALGQFQNTVTEGVISG
jgi:S1-C subfamily serine protease